MTVHIGNNISVDIYATFDTAVTVTAVTKANPGVATATAHGLTDGDIMIFTVSDGMVELDTQVVRVANSDANTFELEGVDTTNYATWASGTAKEVLTWSSLCLTTQYSIANAAPTEIDATTVCDTVARTRFGLPGAKTGSISIQHDPSVTALQTLEAASTSDPIPFRITYPNGNIRYFGALTAYGGGFAGGVNTIETGEIPLTVPARVVQYAS